MDLLESLNRLDIQDDSNSETWSPLSSGALGRQVTV
jgi:hypothetical protein